MHITLKIFLSVTFFFILVESLFTNLAESISAPWQFYFQDPETPIMEGIINFHDKAMFLITFIVFAVGYILFRCVVLFEDKNDNRQSERFIHGTVIEIVWTILPALVLVNLAVPSFSLLYSMDELPTPQGTLKCIGHQWYWSYEYSDNYINAGSGKEEGAMCTTTQPRSFISREGTTTKTENVSPLSLEDFATIDENAVLLKGDKYDFTSLERSSGNFKYKSYDPSLQGSFDNYQSFDTESYLINEAVEDEYHRLLSVDNSARIPAKRHVRILITSADVLHSWAVPSLGIKVDACPGRLNQTSTYLSRAGIKHYGQCSEICGINHGFMPIVVESFDISSVNEQDYIDHPLTDSIVSYA